MRRNGGPYPNERDIRDGFASCLLVINPSRYPRYSRIFARLARRIPVPEVILTRDREHFVASVQEFTRSEYRHLLVWGGDGTAHDAINSLARVPPESMAGKSVGFLRGGSGNGIQDSYEVPYSIRRQMESYALSMLNGYEISVDILRVQDGPGVEFGQLFGVGFDAKVLARRDAGKKVRAGMGRYIGSALGEFAAMDFRALPAFRLRLEEGKYAFRGTRVNAEFPIDTLDLQTRPVMIELGTRPYYGKLFKVCPDVVCNDGFMDVYVFEFADKRSMVLNFGALWNGHHDKINKRAARSSRPVIQRYEVRSLVIQSDSSFSYHVDGELRNAGSAAEGGRIEISVVPTALKFTVPPAFYRLFHPFERIEGS